MDAPRAVRVLTEVAAVDRPFDYLVTEATSHVGVGDRVRIDFNHRVVRGWVISEVPVSPDLKPLSKWLGYGPSPALIDLAHWAGQRWCGPVSRFLIGATPKRQYTSLPVAPEAKPLPSVIANELRVFAPGVHQVSPTTDPLDVVLSAYEQTWDREGSLLVLVPTEAWAARLRGRLEQRGCDVASGDQQWDRIRAGWPVVIGARGAALAPVPIVAGAVIIDADDESYRSEASPTWEATTLMIERCKREVAPLWLTSSVPSPRLQALGELHREEKYANGWARVSVVDRRSSDPHEGVLSKQAVLLAHQALAGEEPVAVLVVLQRLGAGRLFACKKCGELARCTQCGQGEEEVEGKLSCRERHVVRENFCLQCGATNLKRIRSGVSTLARDVSAQLSQPVSEVTAKSELTGPLHRVVVGTEAAWQRVRRCGVVIFVDFDQYLLAPRDSARRQALGAVAKASRLVGSRTQARGSVVLQTRRGEDEVLTALQTANLDAILQEDFQTAQLLGLAPYGAHAEISGEGATEFVAQLEGQGLRIYASEDSYSIQSDSIDNLTSALRQAVRLPKKLRIAVD